MQASSSKPEKKEKDSSADKLAAIVKKADKEEEAEAHRIHGFLIRFQGLHDNPGS